MAKPICTNCQHYRIPDGMAAARCYAPQGITAGERLAGNIEAETRFKYCAIQRDISWPMDIMINGCGQRGRWFQPKQEAV